MTSMSRQTLRQTALVGLFFLGSAVVLGQTNNLSVTVDPLWQGQPNPSFAVEPVRVTVENQGKDDVARILIEGGGDQMSATLDLPAHGVKSVDFYLSRSYGYQPRKLTVVAKHGWYQEDLVTGYSDGNEQNLGYVGDDLGTMTFLRTGSKNGAPWASRKMLDWYCKPEDAPDRAVGYWGMDMVVMGDGSERLSDDVVKAIQRYVLSGGSVVFVGGASKPVLNDKRWSGFLPVVVGSTEETDLPAEVGEYGSNAPNRLAVTSVKAVSGARVWGLDSDPAFVWKAVGIGSIGFLPFDPFASEMRRYDGLKGLFFAINKRMSTDRTSRLVKDFEGPGEEASVPGYYQDNPAGNSVFRVSLPGVWNVGGIMLAYVILVVPINFLVLRRMGKGELAWLTAPILAAGFAGVFFTFSGALYEAGSSKQTSATVVASHGTAIAVGAQQLFLPRGGTYDLKWTGVEAATAADSRNRYDYGYDPTQADQGFSMVEGNGLVVPALQAKNLSFYNYRFAEGLDWTYADPGVLSVKRGATSDSLSGTLTNTTDKTWQGLTVSVANYDYPIETKEVKPGQTVKVSLPIKRVKNKPVYFGQVQLKTAIEGLKLGSQVGKETTPNGTSLYWSLEVKETQE